MKQLVYYAGITSYTLIKNRQTNKRTREGFYYSAIISKMLRQETLRTQGALMSGWHFTKGSNSLSPCKCLHFQLHTKLHTCMVVHASTPALKRADWCKISSSQTKPTATTTKNPKSVTASLTSSDSKEIWNNQTLCIFKFHVYQRLQQRLQTVLYWGLSSVLEYFHSMYKI